MGILGTAARLWDEKILPRVTDIATRTANPTRAELLAQAHGRVLEIGIGTAAGAKFYPDAVTELVGLEPNASACRTAQRRLRKHRPPYATSVYEGTAEVLPFDDGSFDTVVCQLVLCTIPDPAAALGEAKRVLRPGGTLLYLEHVRHETPKVARFQDRVAPLWSKAFGGCRVNQNTGALIEAAGFRPAWHEEESDRMRPRFLSHMIWGAATAS